MFNNLAKHVTHITFYTARQRAPTSTDERESAESPHQDAVSPIARGAGVQAPCSRMTARPTKERAKTQKHAQPPVAAVTSTVMETTQGSDGQVCEPAKDLDPQEIARAAQIPATSFGCAQEAIEIATETTMLDAPAPHQQPAKKPDPLEIISKCIVKARSANFGEEIELGVTLFRSGTAVVRIERHDVTVTAQLTEESLQQLATGMLTVIGNARHVRGDANHAIDADCDVDPLTDNCRVCGVHHSDACQSCGARAFHVDGCPGGV